MATSNSIDFSSNRNSLIKDAYLTAEIYGPEEEISGADLLYANRSLNRMVKAWQTKGLNLYALEEATIFLAANTSKYSLSSTGAHASTSVVETEIRTALAASTPTVEVDSTTGMTVGDNIGIETDDNTIEWTTIASITDGDTLELTTGITTTAAVDKNVYTYTTRLSRPLDIHQVRFRDDNNIDRELTKISRQEYFALTNKSASGNANSFYFDPQLTSGNLHIWPVTTSMANKLEVTVTRTLHDFDSASDTPDFPVEWEEALVYGLAARLALTKGRPTEASLLFTIADSLLQDVLSWDNEKSSLRIQPEIRNG